MHTFRPVTPNREALVTVALGRPDWPVGSIIYRGGAGPNLRVVEWLEMRAARRMTRICSGSSSSGRSA